MTINRQRLFWFTFVLVNLLSVLVLTFFSYFDWSILTGYIAGAILSLCSYLLNKWFTWLLLSKRRSFKFGCFISIVKFLIIALLHSGLFIGLLFANNFYNKTYVTGLFNIFTFIYGVSIVILTLIISAIVEKIYKNKKNKEQ